VVWVLSVRLSPEALPGDDRRPELPGRNQPRELPPRRLGWETVELDPRTLIEVGGRREQFLRFVTVSSGRKLYGVNVHAGDGSNRLTTAAEQRDYENGLHSGTSFGEPLPRRVVRGIVLARDRKSVV
jgi:hypothetical protein